MLHPDDHIKYRETERLLWHKRGGGRVPVNQRRIKSNTILVRESLGGETDADIILVRLHGTHVVALFPSGRMVLNSGGYRTVTTKRRINEYIWPLKVWSEEHEWKIGWMRDEGIREAFSTEFFDHMFVFPQQRIIQKYTKIDL